MTTVMITGGTGFIGHNVVLDLLETTDWDFQVVDKMSYAGSMAKLVENPRFDPDRVEVIRWDLTRPLEVLGDGIWKTSSPYTVNTYLVPEIIINLASDSHVDNSITDPVPFVYNNVMLVTRMLEFARACKPKMFIQFSTDEVYGPALSGEDFEEWSTIIPSNPYAASKAAQEAIAISYWRTYRVPLVITNCMNVIGPGQHPEKFVPKAVEHLLREEPMPVHAQATEKPFIRKGDEVVETINVWDAGSRHYTYVSNVSSALMFIAKTTPALYGIHGVDRPDRFNLVGNQEIKNDDMVRMIADILKVEPGIQYVDFHSSRPGHDRRYALDGHKLASLGWTAPVDFHEGLKSAVLDSISKERVT